MGGVDGPVLDVGPVAPRRDAGQVDLDRVPCLRGGVVSVVIMPGVSSTGWTHRWAMSMPSRGPAAQPERWVGAAEEGDTGSDGDRRDLEDQFVDLVVEGSGERSAADEPQTGTRLVLERTDPLDRVVGNHFDGRVGAAGEGAGEDQRLKE
jgi:hypothetical protein